MAVEEVASTEDPGNRHATRSSRRERATGIEPAFSAWEADVLPLNYARGRGHTILFLACNSPRWGSYGATIRSIYPSEELLWRSGSFWA